MKFIEEYWIAAIAFAIGVVVTFMFVDMREHKYHCHAKNHKMYKSIKPDGNVYLKTDKDCIDIRSVKYGKGKFTKT